MLPLYSPLTPVGLSLPVSPRVEEWDKRKQSTSGSASRGRCCFMEGGCRLVSIWGGRRVRGGRGGVALAEGPGPCWGCRHRTEGGIARFQQSSGPDRARGFCPPEN